MKKLSDYLLSDVVKNTTFNTLKTKSNSLENKIPDATTLTHISQHNTDKQNLEKKIGYVDKKSTEYKMFSDYNCLEYKN